MKSRPYPWHLRIVPNRFIWYTRDGAILQFWKEKYPKQPKKT